MHLEIIQEYLDEYQPKEYYSEEYRDPIAAYLQDHLPNIVRCFVHKALRSSNTAHERSESNTIRPFQDQLHPAASESDDAEVLDENAGEGESEKHPLSHEQLSSSASHRPTQRPSTPPLSLTHDNNGSDCTSEDLLEVADMVSIHDKVHPDDAIEHTATKIFVCKGVLKNGQNWGCNKEFSQAWWLGRHFKSDEGMQCFFPLFRQGASERKWNLQAMQDGLLNKLITVFVENLVVHVMQTPLSMLSLIDLFDMNPGGSSDTQASPLYRYPWWRLDDDVRRLLCDTGKVGDARGSRI